MQFCYYWIISEYGTISINVMHSHDQYKYRLFRKSGHIVLRGCLMSIWSFYIPKCFSIISPLSSRGKNAAKPACYEVAKGRTSFPSMNWKACLWEKEISLCNGVTIPYTIVFARYIPAPMVDELSIWQIPSSLAS